MASEPVLFIHAGSHKTGTTAIQQTLGAARGELRRQGICWPRLGSSPVHHKFMQSLHDRGLRARLEAGWMTGRIRRQSHGCRATVLSSERLYWIGDELIGHDPQESDARLRRRSEVLGRLRALFADEFDIRVILYLRRVDVFAEPIFKELLFRKYYRAGTSSGASSRSGTCCSATTPGSANSRTASGPEPQGVPRSLWPAATAHAAFLDAHRSATLEPLLPAVDAGPTEFGPLTEAQFERCLDAWEHWRRSDP